VRTVGATTNQARTTIEAAAIAATRTNTTDRYIPSIVMVRTTRWRSVKDIPFAVAPTDRNTDRRAGAEYHDLRTAISPILSGGGSHVASLGR
jgi:hypothetical protein